MQDQYVNHIMNETGATVSLRGQHSGIAENGQSEGCHCGLFCWHLPLPCLNPLVIFLCFALPAATPQPLHLFLSSNDAKSLERAKLLAENLLDTISAEFGASR